MLSSPRVSVGDLLLVFPKLLRFPTTNFGNDIFNFFRPFIIVFFFDLSSPSPGRAYGREVYAINWPAAVLNLVG